MGFFESNLWSSGTRDTQRLISQFDGLSSSTLENPRNVPWNNKDTEFEEGWQNYDGLDLVYVCGVLVLLQNICFEI